MIKKNQKNIYIVSTLSMSWVSYGVMIVTSRRVGTTAEMKQEQIKQLMVLFIHWNWNENEWEVDLCLLFSSYYYYY